MQKFTNIKPYINWFKLQRIPEHKIAYLEFGSHNNPNVVICAHGLTRNAYDFTKIAKSLSSSFRVIALTYPGRGDSDHFKNKNHYNYEVYAKDTLIFLKNLKIKNPFWLGTSMGGIIGMVLASKYPKIFKGVILNDIGPFIPASAIFKIGKYARQSPYFTDLDKAQQHLKMIYAPFGITSQNDWDHLTKYSFIQNTHGLYQMNYDTGIINRAKFSKKPKDINIWSIWHKISCPLMVIHGAKSDILGYATIDQMKQTKKFNLHTVDYAGHAPSLMSSDQIDAVKIWLDQQV